MGEAAEIAKLRLFLKLAAQLDDVSQIEPLPDLDFNIKRGNLLVGIADRDDARRRFGEVLGLYPAEQAAEQAADAYDEFVAMQVAGVEGSGVSGKESLKGRIGAAAGLADTALYDIRGEQVERDLWKETHAPFHWFAEYPSVWQEGGFDVIVGNPPYVSKNKVTEYTWWGYATQKCPDLYAVCVERACTLLNEQGRMAMIVMHSLCFSRGFRALREHLTGWFPSLWVSSYSRIPDGLFSGSARVRNSIVVAGRRGDHSFFTTQCRRWLTKSRPTLFSAMEYVSPDTELLRCGRASKWPFINSALLSRAFAMMIKTLPLIGESGLVKESEYKLAVKDNAQYKLGIYDEPPLDIHLNGDRRVSSKYNWFSFTTAEERDVAWLIWGGRWGYLWWLTYDDEFDVNKGVLSAFPSDLAAIVVSPQGNRLLQLAGELRRELPNHLSYKPNAGIRVARYDILKCHHITDEADLLLAQVWGIRFAYEAAGNLRDRMTFGQRG